MYALYKKNKRPNQIKIYFLIVFSLLNDFKLVKIDIAYVA